MPFTVKVNPAAPAIADDGESQLTVGSGLLVLKVAAEEVPPPGVGLDTVTLMLPAEAMSAEVTEAVSCVPLT
ncbi:MAG TPA: hypothetical protein VKB47_11570 [Terracidiphilus sp.]|nr:hypothetical protein [Terracidiphilus sp.]